MLAACTVKALLALLAVTRPQSFLAEAATTVTCGDYGTLDVGTSYEVDNNGTWPCQINFNVNNRWVQDTIL